LACACKMHYCRFHQVEIVVVIWVILCKSLCLDVWRCLIKHVWTVWPGLQTSKCLINNISWCCLVVKHFPFGKGIRYTLYTQNTSGKIVIEKDPNNGVYSTFCGSLGLSLWNCLWTTWRSCWENVWK